MAVEAVKGIYESVGDVNRHALEVMARKTTSYDYEKVFWNSTYSVGIFGLAWAAVKLGQWVKGLGTLGTAVSNALETTKALLTGEMSQDIYNFIYERSEPDAIHREDKEPDWIQKLLSTAGSVWLLQFVPFLAGLKIADMKREFECWRLILKFREDAALWEAWKAEMAATDKHWKYTGVEGSIKLPEDAGDVLDVLDGFFSSYGSVVPVGIVAAHAALEFLRKREYLGKVDRMAGDVTLAVGGLGAGVVALDAYDKATRK
jgi:hypothetical protein